MDKIDVNQVLENQKCSRDKYWSEVDEKEKCKRLRREVQSLQFRMKEQSTFIKKLLLHAHLGNELVTVLQPDDEPKFEDIRLNVSQGDDVYF